MPSISPPNSSQPVSFQRKGALAIATLNREARLNALSLEMVDLLYPQLLQWQADDSIKAVWLEGAGSRAFCAGGDMVGIYHSIIKAGGNNRNMLAENFFAHEYRLDYLLYHYGKPIICWGQGIVMGGGLGLMVGCSHRIVTPSTRIAMPEITIGLYPDVGGSRFLARMPGDIGLFLGLTGAPLNATDAHYVGVADYLLADDARTDIIEKLANSQWTDSTRKDDAVVTRLLRRHVLPLSDWPEEVLKPHFDIINDLCDADDLPGIVGRICDYAGNDPWLAKAVATLTSGSPQSAWLVWIAQQQAQGMALAEIFRMEWILSMQCVLHDDLREGIRALLVDKDKKPHFRHTHVSELTEDYLLEFLELPTGLTVHPLADLGT
jgi:enoyl-CoA hydratase/carnithine racemase